MLRRLTAPAITPLSAARRPDGEPPWCLLLVVEETFEYPVVDGIDDPEGIPALDDLEGPELDLTDLESLEETQALLTELGLLS